MIKKFYHGAPLEESIKIMKEGFLTAGCICDDKELASVYAQGNGYVFTVYQNWPISAIIKLYGERIVLSVFSFSESCLEWLYNHGIVPHNCTEYVNDPINKDIFIRRLRVQKAERIAP